MSVYFWSDTHFNHNSIIGYTNRPYADVEAMNEGLIYRWNSVVGKNDDIYLLGDFGFGRLSKLQPIFDRLHGNKHLIVGNHDEANDDVLKLKWSTKRDLATVRVMYKGLRQMRFIACHYPLETWRNAQRGYLHVHGHSHGSLKRVIPHRWDVGADVEPVPVRAETLIERGDAEMFLAQDHHGD